ncbi:MAG: PHP domain-containing protein [Verrucomicrobia bacterium]|jgi:UDP-N-acetylglucosamine:LPS N-acetylglucosamine transferase|nr:PHP domain-containing protein [Verrucomicrobiota bacterium]
MKRILILTAGFGDGHNAAARNLRHGIESISDEAKVEVLDLFESTYGSLNTLMRHAYQGVVQYAPTVWAGVFSVFDNPALFRRQVNGLSRLRDSLAQVLNESEPDCVVSTYPVYAHLIDDLYRDHAERPFRLITVVTDSLTICSAWYRASIDVLVVPNDETREVLIEAGVARGRIQALGFPVSLDFTLDRPQPMSAPQKGEPRRILYPINTGKKKSGRVIERLLDLPDTHLTITVGRDAGLRAELHERFRHQPDRVRVLGWTNSMPKLLMSHHLVITKAGGAMVQEALAGHCPLILNQVIPGQEEGNARLVEKLGAGMVVEKSKHIAAAVEEAFADKSKLWRRWQENIQKAGHPDAALRVAELALAESHHGSREPRSVKLFEEPAAPPAVATPHPHKPPAAKALLCDFHIHTNYSDGRLALPEVVDFYGRRGFDCICITDHVADPRRLIGRMGELINLTIPYAQLEEYFDMVERERKRAWRKYSMRVMTGIEFNKEGFTKKTSGHLLGLDLKAPIDPALGFVEIIAQIQSQGGLSVAAHPHLLKSEWGKNTLYLWENQELFAPIIDAWEIANRNNIFTPVGLKRFAFLANSDFHKPKHIYSWKTLLHCDNDPDAIKDCVRRNEHVALTLYRDGLTGEALRAQPRTLPLRASEIEALPAKLFGAPI